VPRRIIEDAVERLIAELDARDGDPEAKCNGDLEHEPADGEWSTVPATGGVLGLPYDNHAADAALLDHARASYRQRREGRRHVA
jgi:hypothetical protein